MAIKTFTAGEVLTASDTNTYLANSGLVWIANGTASTTDFRLTCFSSTYDSYRLVISNCTTAGVRAVNLQLCIGTTIANTNYKYGGSYVTWTGLSGNVPENAGTFWNIITASTSGDSSGSWDIHRPFIADQTNFNGHATNFDAGLVMAGNNLNATSYDGIRITNGSGDTTNFSYAIYGYRKS